MSIMKKLNSNIGIIRILSLLLVTVIVVVAAVSCSDNTGPGPGEINAGPGEINAGPGEIDAGPGQIDAGPGESDFKEINGSGNIETREYDVSSINKVEVGGEGVLIIEQGDAEELVIETDDNLFEYVKVSVADGILTIETTYDQGYDLVPTDSINYYLKLKDLEELRLPGAVSVKCDDIQLSSLDLDMSGVASVEIAGEVDILDISVGGVGTLKGRDLSTTECNISGDGNANITLRVSNKLDVVFTGIGKINYIGSPEVNKQDVGKLVEVAGIN